VPHLENKVVRLCSVSLVSETACMHVSIKLQKVWFFIVC